MGIYNSQGILDQAEKLLQRMRKEYEQSILKGPQAQTTADVPSVGHSLDVLVLGVSQSEAVISDLRGETDRAKPVSHRFGKASISFALEIISMDLKLRPTSVRSTIGTGISTM